MIERAVHSKTTQKVVAAVENEDENNIKQNAKKKTDLINCRNHGIATN